jgi:two-component system sensor histidine kinase PhoQ
MALFDWRPFSLQARQLLAAGIGLVAFLGLTGYALDQAFTETAEASLRDRLRSYAYAYFGGMEFTRGGRLIEPETPPDPRFNTPGSGLYAAASGPGLLWESTSTLGHQLPLDVSLAPAAEHFAGPVVIEDHGDGSGEAYHYGIGLIWEIGANEPEVAFTFHVFEDAAALEYQVSVFRRALWGYLGAAALLLIGVQVLVLRWSLQPLRSVGRELDRVRRGKDDCLSDRHPRELEPLTRSINTLIDTERQQRDRYRHTLADLAHSLKTPLAVLRARMETVNDANALREEVAAQVARMSDIVSYQLSRAVAGGHSPFAAAQPIAPRAEEIVVSLEKVYADKGVLCEFEIEPDAAFHGELGDLQELLGNLLENAFKWARSRVLLTVTNVPPDQPSNASRAGLHISVEDDGPGIAADKVESVLQRGVRGDERVHGHGIGLAIVQDIVRAYDGQLRVSQSEELGGAQFDLHFPPRG